MPSSSQNNNSFNIDARIINSFLTGTLGSFKEMVRIEPSVGRPVITSDSTNHRWEVSGAIEITGEFEGMIALRLPSVLAEKILEKRGTPILNQAERQNLIRKFVDRLIQKVSEKAAAELSGYDISIIPPYTVYGKNHKINWPADNPIIGVTLRTSMGSFELATSIYKS